MLPIIWVSSILDKLLLNCVIFLLKPPLSSMLYLLFFPCYVGTFFTMSVTSASKLFPFKEIHETSKFKYLFKCS